VRPWKREEGLWLGCHRRTGRTAYLKTEAVGMLAGPVPRLLVVEDDGDSWGTDRWSYGRILGEFKPSVRPRIVERGPVRTIVETRAAYKSSRIVQQTIFYPSWPVVELRLQIQWNEAKMRLKLGFPTAFGEAAGILCEVPGGAVPRPADGQEHVHGRWCLAEGVSEGSKAAFGIAHGGLHGISFQKGEIGLSVLRSSAYCHEQGFKLGPERAYKLADQGVHDIRLALTAGRPDEVRRILPGLGDWLSSPPAVYAHLPFGPVMADSEARPNGSGAPAASIELGESGAPSNRDAVQASMIAIAPPNIRLLACKRSDDGKALIIRLQESAGRKTKALLTAAPPNGKRSDPIVIEAIFSPFEIKTLRVDRSGRWRNVDLIEER
jgi:alpha-mannosidase